MANIYVDHSDLRPGDVLWMGYEISEILIRRNGRTIARLDDGDEVTYQGRIQLRSRRGTAESVIEAARLVARATDLIPQTNETAALLFNLGLEVRAYDTLHAEEG